MSFRTLALALAGVLFCSASASRAKADHPADGFRLGAGLVSGLLLNADAPGDDRARARGNVNPQQLGFLGSMGYSFPGGFYLGGSMKIFLGQQIGDPALLETTIMTQQFVLDLGYAIGISDELSIRPMLELALNRYGTRLTTPVEEEKRSDVGIMANPGVDLVADVSDHFWLGGGVRLAFALMGDDADDDINYSGGSIDVSLQMLVTSGLRF